MGKVSKIGQSDDIALEIDRPQHSALAGIVRDARGAQRTVRLKQGKGTSGGGGEKKVGEKKVGRRRWAKVGEGVKGVKGERKV